MGYIFMVYTKTILTFSYTIVYICVQFNAVNRLQYSLDELL